MEEQQPHQPNLRITGESTNNQVIEWLQNYEGGIFNAKRLHRFNGKMLFGFSESQLGECFDDKLVGFALYNTLHPRQPKVQQDILYSNKHYHMFLIEGSRATIKHIGASFKCDILVDTGSSFELILPLPKIKQLKLKPKGEQKAEGIDKSEVLMQRFKPGVTLILNDENGTPHEFRLTVHSVGKLTEMEKNEMISEYKENTISAFEYELKNGELYDIPLSPVFQREEKYAKEIPVLGFPGLHRMGVDIDFEKNRMCKARFLV